MSSALNAASTSIRKRIADSDPGLLIELPIADSEIERLIDELAKFVGSGKVEVSSVTPVLALVAVHIAANAEESDSAFRDLLYTRLRFEGNGDALWQNVHGPAIRKFLEQVFPDVDLPEPGKPYAYVGSVYRHCGVPLSARKRFAELLAELVIRQGWHFSPPELRTACSEVPSPVLHDFLNSDSGFSFCRIVCRATAEVLEDAQSLQRVPEYRRTLVAAVHESIRSRQSVVPAYWPEPEIRIDVSSGRVDVWLDPKALASHVYTDQQGNILRDISFDIVECPDVITFSGTAWRVGERWKRNQHLPGYFRSDSGKLIEHARVARKDCIVLCCGPRPKEIHEWTETASLVFRDEPSAIWSVLKYSTNGTEIDSRDHPKLKWLRDRGTPDLPVGYFVGALPILAVEGIEGPNNGFEIEVCTSAGLHTMPIRRRMVIEDVPPGTGYIRLVKRNSSAEVARLRFTLLPRGFHLAVVELAVGPTDSFHVHCLVPSGWSASFSAPHEVVRNGLFSLRGTEWSIAVDLSDGRYKISQDLAVPRVVGRNLVARAGDADEQIVWENEHKSVVVSAGSRGQAGLQCSRELKLLCEVSPDAGTRALEFEDAVVLEVLQEQPVAALMIAARDRRVATGLYFASSQHVRGALIRNQWDINAIDGPSHFLTWLKWAKAIATGADANHASPGPIRNRDLRQIACDLQAGSILLGKGVPTTNAYPDLTPDPGIIRVTEWFMRAKEASLREFDSIDDLIETCPMNDIKTLELVEWRKGVLGVLESLKGSPGRTVSRLRSIKMAVQKDPHLLPDHELTREPGGTDFLKALQVYRKAGSGPKSTRNTSLLSAKEHVNDTLRHSSDGNFLIPLATLLKALILFRSGYRRAASDQIRRTSIPTLLERAFGELERACETGTLRSRERVEMEIQLADLFDAWPNDGPSDGGNNGSSI